MARRTPNPCHGATLAKRSYPTAYYAIHTPWKASGKQLLTYCTAKGYRKLVLNKEGRPTFDEDALRKLRKRYPKDAIFQLLDRQRELQKAKGTYVEGLVPRADGRYGEQFTHLPSTLRLAARLLQLLPRVDSDDPDGIYNQIRGLFVAGPGHIFIGRDFSGIEAVLVFYLAGDQQGLRLAGKVGGVHDFIASHAIGQPADLSWSDEDLAAFFAGKQAENANWKLANGDVKPYKVIRSASKKSL